MNAKQKKAVSDKLAKQLELIRQQYWPDVTDDQLWDRRKSGGFTTIPRSMPQIMALIDALAEKGKPPSQAYLALWFRVFDTAMQVRITSPGQIAAESGFGGERAISTWQGRMQKLLELGFIKVGKGTAGPYEYVLILNPYHVIYRLCQDGQLDSATLQQLWHELRLRAVDIVAKDLDEIAEAEAVAKAPPPPPGFVPPPPSVAPAAASSLADDAKQEA